MEMTRAERITHETVSAETQGPRDSRSGREVAVFLTLTFALSSIFYALIISAGGKGSPLGQLYLLGLMWCPGISALAVRLLFHRTLGGLGWGWKRARLQLLAYLLPLAYVSVVYLPTWALSLGRFNKGVLSRSTWPTDCCRAG